MPSAELQWRAKRRFCASLTTLAMAMSICSLRLSSTSAEAMSVEPFVRGSLKRRSAEQELFDLSESEDTPNRVPIHSFRIVLEPTPQPFTVADADDMHDVLQTFLSAYVKDELEPEGMVLDYLMLADVQVVNESRRRLQVSESSSTLFVSAGVASFTSSAYPTEAQLEALIAQGLENTLPGALVNTDYAYIEAVDYISLTSSPTPSPQAAAGAQKADQDDVNSNMRIGIIAAGATGACIGVFIIAAALLARRHRGPSLASHLERDYKDNETQLDTSCGDDASLQTSGSRRTRDDSDAWTMPSLADDANTVFTNFSIKSLSTSANIHRTESFELDRQVSIRKDMLHTSPAWTTTELSKNNSGRKTDDTVLKPSHFGLDDEFEAQNSSKVKSEVGPFRFEEANDEGEEIYLMPPKKRKSKVPRS